MYQFLRIIPTLRKINLYVYGMDFWVRKTQKWWNFHVTAQCYGLMLCIAVMLHSNFLHLLTSLRTALVSHAKQHLLSMQTVLLPNGVTLHVYTHLKTPDSNTHVFFSSGFGTNFHSLNSFFIRWWQSWIPILQAQSNISARSRTVLWSEL